MSTDIPQCLQLLLDSDGEPGQVDSPRVLLELAGIDFAGLDKVFKNVFRRGYPGFELIERGVVKGITDGADGFDAVERFSDDARQER